MLENGITVHYNGESRDLELEAGEAQRMWWYAGAAVNAPSYEAITEPEAQERQRAREAKVERATSFAEQLKRIANLEPDDLARVFALIELIEYGDSWMLEIINGLLADVIFEGPAKANEGNPTHILSDFAHELSNWWDDIDRAKQHVANHPDLFPAPPAPPEPSAAPEPPAEATTTAKARKPRKRAA